MSESMTENNVIAEWLDYTLNVTGNMKDIVVVTELYKLFKDDSRTFITNYEFKRRCKAHLKSKRVVFRDIDIVVESDRRKYVRNTMRGAVLSIEPRRFVARRSQYAGKGVAWAWAAKGGFRRSPSIEV